MTGVLLLYVQITYSFPSTPTESLMLPYLFRMVPSEAALPLAIQAVIEEYGWTRVALLTQDVSVFAAVSQYIHSHHPTFQAPDIQCT